MGTFFFQEGLVIFRNGQHLEYKSRYNQEIYFEDPESGKRVTILETEFWGEFQTKRLKITDAFSSPSTLILPSEPAQEQIKNLADLKPKHQADIERKFIYISRLREAGITKGQTKLIAAEAQRIAVEIKDPKGVPGTSTIQAWWKRFEKSNYEVYVLVSVEVDGFRLATTYIENLIKRSELMKCPGGLTGNAHRNRGKKTDVASEAFLQEFIDKKYAIRTQAAVSGVYGEYTKALADPLERMVSTAHRHAL